MRNRKKQIWQNRHNKKRREKEIQCRDKFDILG